MSTALAIQNNDLLTFDDNKLELIRKTVARDLTPVEFEFFMAVARSRGLDPIQNQIHAVVRGSGDKRKMTIQVAIDGFRLIAARTGNFAGIDAPKFLYDKDGNPIRCQVTVYRMVQNQRCAFVATAKWSEFLPEGNMAFMWKKMPEVMLSKVTEAQALRKAFPADLSGLYEDSEMHQADRDVTPALNTAPPPVKTSTDIGLPQPALSPGDFVIGFGRKYNGQKLKSIPRAELESYIDWLKAAANKDGKQLNTQVELLIQNFNALHGVDEIEAAADRLTQDDLDFNRVFPEGAAR